MELVSPRRDSQPEPGPALSARTNYFLGGKKENWRTGVAQFQNVRYPEIYRGIDLIYYSSGKRLEYDFVVSPGADPALIGMRFPGARPRLDADGNLILRAGRGEVRHLAPFIYQRRGAERVEVSGGYAIQGDQVRFVIGDYDRSRELVIDPVLTYASYLGGANIDAINASAVDKEGRIWVTGVTYSQIDVPGGTEPPQTTNAGLADAFLAAFATNEEGVLQLVYYTYIGGTGNDEATAISFDPYGFINLAGSTDSIDFPLGGNANQIQIGGGIDSFVMQIHQQDPGTAALFYSSYYGGEANEIALVVAASRTTIVVGGRTDAGVLPGAGDNSLQKSNRGGIDAFLFASNPYAASAGEALTYATFFGGNGADFATGLAIEPSGTILVSGFTSSSNFPLAGTPYLDYLNGRGDAFLTRLDFSQPGLGALLYSTYIGGLDTDSAEAMLLAPDGTIWLTGYTLSRDYPLTYNAAQPNYVHDADAFITQVTLPTEGRMEILYSSYLGGSGGDIPYAIALDANGKVWIGGYSNSVDFPRVGEANPQTDVRVTEMFVAQIDPTIVGPPAITLSTLFGGVSTDALTGLGLDAAGNILAAGYTTSNDLPVTNGAGKPGAAGLRSGFVVRFSATPQE